jgi:ubiquinone/menaquinone biosynthesis C-methylase UbiE
MNSDLHGYYNESKEYISLMQSHNLDYFATYLDLIKSNLKYLQQESGRLLELGCGGGQSTNYLANTLAKFTCTGTDISKTAIDSAREKYMLKNLKFEVADVHSLPYSDGEFDLVTSCDVIEHLPDIQKALEEMIRVLKSNGLIIIKAPHHRNPLLPLIDLVKFRNRYPFTKTWFDNFPRFFSLSIGFVTKLINPKVKFISRIPDLSDTVQVGKDADAVQEISVIDLVKYLKQNGMEIKNIAQPRNKRLLSAVYSKIFPYFSSIGIVAQKK